MKVKPKVCKSCGHSFIPFNTLTVVCSASCALKFNSKKEIQKRIKEMKTEVRTINDYRAVARAVFQKWIRKRDEDQPCISCGTFTSKQWDGGHYLKAEIFTGLIFDPINCNKQCAYCNGPFMAGNLIEYRKGLINKYSLNEVEDLEARADVNRSYKFTKAELIEITNYYKEKLKK